NNELEPERAAILIEQIKKEAAILIEDLKSEYSK
ncbi:MAG: hypothetical protein JWO32_1443, partial [Bacteroidetes bacterium]|nr:hypothetical protein [Bacteroidota bacterium]